MSVETPHVAVCIPVRGDTTGLRRCLAAVEAVDWPRDRLRVVVAVDGPDVDAVAAARAGGADVVVLPAPSGSYAARNAALDELSPDVAAVLFTDADCVPQPGWVRGHVAALAGAELSGGAIEVTVRDEPTPAEYLDSVLHLQQESNVEQHGYAVTANLAARADVIRSLRFDASLRTGGDVELCERARAAGHRLVYTPDAVVRHDARRTARAVLRKTRRIAQGMAARPDRWRDRALTPLLPVRGVVWPVARARRVGASRGFVWDVRLGVLAYARLLVMRAGARRARKAA